MIRPLPSRVLLAPIPTPQQSSGGLHLPDRGLERWYDASEWVILQCGVSVPSELQPGQRVVIDPGSQEVKNFEYRTLPMKTCHWKEVKLILREASE